MKDNYSQPAVISLFDTRPIGDIEEELIEELYRRRSYEIQIADYHPQSSAPAELIKKFINSKKRVQGIERQIRLRRHGF
jgi:hypothetical protein